MTWSFKYQPNQTSQLVNLSPKHLFVLLHILFLKLYTFVCFRTCILYVSGRSYPESGTCKCWRWVSLQCYFKRTILWLKPVGVKDICDLYSTVRIQYGWYKYYYAIISKDVEGLSFLVYLSKINYNLFIYIYLLNQVLQFYNYT